MKVTVSIEITSDFYKTILEGTKLLEYQVRNKYGKPYKINEEYFIRNAVADYICNLKDELTFNEN